MAAKRKSRKKITLNEFRAWLEGVEELQPDDWCPNVDQWNLIRNKIVNIIEPVVETPVPVQPAPGQPRHVNIARPPHGVPAMPVTPSHVPADVVDASITPEASKMLNSGSGKTTTPDIDSSGGYNSTFG